jgi:4-alpha-glucanotransferase
VLVTDRRSTGNEVDGGTRRAGGRIEPGYRDRHGIWRTASRETIAALSSMLEVDGAEISVVVARAGEPRDLPGTVEIVTEAGETIAAPGRLPPELPPGYHTLVDSSGAPARLILSPGICHPAPGRRWGWATQLYALRSRASWGMGDLADLRRLGRWSASQGAGITVVNPLHAPRPGLPQEASPYFPSSRCFINPLYLRIEEVPGAAGAGVDLGRLNAAGQKLNSTRLIDRDEVYRLKMSALGVLWPRRPADRRFDAFVERSGHALRSFALYMALYDHHGGPPSRWPPEHRHPGSAEVERFGRTHPDRIAFHSWVQWLLDEQVRAAAEGVGLIGDLAVGVDPEGADAWLWQDAFAAGASVGAPPDQFNRRGQDWGVLAFNPFGLRAASYDPFIQTVRAGLRHAAGMRFDHVMGLWRLWLIPPGADPSAGAYVTYPVDDLLDILALESRRASAVVVGEDLGTVEPEVRTELTRRKMLSYKVLWFEEDPPADYPAQALATVTNHDLPTVTGLWTGADLDAQRAMDLDPDVAGLEAIIERLHAWLGLELGTAPVDVVRAAYKLLGTAPSALLTATLEDALGVSERPNQPGTTTQWPNWRLALPRFLEDVERVEVAHDIARALSEP